MLLEVVLIFLSTAILLVIYFRWNYGTLEKLGIPVVETHFLLGSQSDFHKIIGHERDYEWFETHGEIYGVYNGRQPEIHIVDPEIVRQILITDFSKFVNRSFDLGTKASSVLCEIMDFIKDDKWRTVRATLSPMFTTAKLKRLNMDMIGATDNILNLLMNDVASAPNKILQDYNIYGDLFAIVLDATARCTLNIKIQNPRSPDNDFAKAVLELTPQKSFFMATVLNIFPELEE
ncbi:unnamed protein product [Allacma fusca]|uniref:Cytochrome P450 n=1 Tax=Allacma fusca TaxID=39272 RepID=A0A8J2KAQ2_9HEXA|nr:unnamed protein product [Allacma fusca]